MLLEPSSTMTMSSWVLHSARKRVNHANLASIFRGIWNGFMVERSSFKKMMFFRASLVVQWLRLCFHCRGHGFHPWLGNWDPACLRMWPKAKQTRTNNKINNNNKITKGYFFTQCTCSVLIQKQNIEIIDFTNLFKCISVNSIHYLLVIVR